MSVYSLDQRSPEDVAESHPMIRWLVRMHERGSGFNAVGSTVSETDYMLSPACSARFGMMVEEDGGLALAAQPLDLDALLSVDWASAAFARGLRGKDYIILNCKDLTGGNGPNGEVQMRVFFELSMIMADALSAADPFPSHLRLRPMVIMGGIPLHSKGPAKAEMPLVYKPIT